MYKYTDYSKLRSATITGPNEVMYLFLTGSEGHYIFHGEIFTAALLLVIMLYFPAVSSANQPGEPDVLLAYSDILALHDLLSQICNCSKLDQHESIWLLLHPAESV